MAYATKGLRNVFNCCCCDVLFSPSIDSPNAPIHLNACGHLMCLGCVMKNRREELKRYPESRPFSVDCVTCSSTSNDLHEPTRAKYLIDILLEIDSQCKSKYFQSTVVDAAQLTSLTCPGCTTRYWWHPDVHSAYILVCGHALCMVCVEMKKREKSEEETARHGCGLSNVVDCSTCGLGTMFNSTEEQRDPIGGIIEWLEVKKEEHFQSQPENQFNCFDCRGKTPIDHGLVCADCSTEDTERKLCVFCVCSTHKGHKYDPLVRVKLESIKTSALSETYTKIVECYSNASEILEKYNSLMGTIKECFSAAINLIPEANKCSDGMTIAIELKEKGEKYDAIMGPFLPIVRTNIQSLENFIGEFRKRFPEVNGESVQEEEKEDGERAAKRPRLDESAEDGEKQRNGEDTEI